MSIQEFKFQTGIKLAEDNLTFFGFEMKKIMIKYNNDTDESTKVKKNGKIIQIQKQQQSIFPYKSAEFYSMHSPHKQVQKVSQYGRSSQQHNSPIINEKFRSQRKMKNSSQYKDYNDFDKAVSIDQFSQATDDDQNDYIASLKTQQGSREIQKQLSKWNEYQIDHFLSQTQSQISNLMQDNYANYIFKSLSQQCNEKQRILILKSLFSEFTKISNNKKGTHALQHLIKCIETDQEQQIIKSILNQQIQYIILDSQGAHIVKKIVSQFNLENIDQIYNYIIQNFLIIINNQHGICVFKDIVKRYQNDKERSLKLIQNIEINIASLIQNLYGNYAISVALEVIILIRLIPMSNVVIQQNMSKAILYNQLYRRFLVMLLKIQFQLLKIFAEFIEIICSDSIIIEMISNKFSQFVFNKTFTNSSQEQKSMLIQALKNNIQEIQNPSNRQKWLQFIHDNSTQQ